MELPKAFTNAIFKVELLTLSLLNPTFCSQTKRLPSIMSLLVNISFTRELTSNKPTHWHRVAKVKPELHIANCVIYTAPRPAD